MSRDLATPTDEMPTSDKEKMMHNIFGDRFFGRTGPAWHELGTTDPGIVLCSKAVRRAKLDYRVFLAPVSGQVDTPMGTVLVNVPNKMMILREPTTDDPEHRFFGFASPDYGILQNMEIAKALDVLNDDWPVETVGALGMGETVFFTLDAGERKVRGEDIKLYFLITDTRDGGTSLKIVFTPVRVVCNNTLITGLRQSLVTVSLEHIAGLKAAFESRVALVQQMTAAQDATMTVFDRMARCSLKKQEIEFVLKQTYPDPRKPKKATILDDLSDADAKLIGVLYDEASEVNQLWEYYCNRAQMFRDAAGELVSKHNDEFPKTANTAWAVYNAVVESADFRRGSDGIAASAIWGPRSQEKKRAFRAAVDLMDKRK